MSEDLLSALLDGECSPDEVKRLLDQAAASPELGRRWARLCAVRDAVAGTRVQRPAPDFCAGVMAAIAEPAAATPAKPVVTPIRAKRPAAQLVRRRRSARWQPWAGMAVAASVATVAVLGARGWLQGPATSPVVATAAGQTAATTPVVASTGPAEIPWGKLDATAARQLNELMIEHSSMRADQGMVGPLNYARMAVRTADYQPDEQR